jgi:hypothetical protein
MVRQGEPCRGEGIRISSIRAPRQRADACCKLTDRGAGGNGTIGPTGLSLGFWDRRLGCIAGLAWVGSFCGMPHGRAIRRQRRARPARLGW